MLGLEHHAIAVALVALDGGFGVVARADHGHHDVVDLRALLTPDEHEVALADVRLDHAVAPHAQREQVFAPSRQRPGGDLDVALAVFHRQQRLARCDAAEDGQPVRLRAAAAARHRERARRAAGAHPPLQLTFALERLEVIEGGARRDLELLADLANRGRDTVLAGERLDELQDIALALRHLSHARTLLNTRLACQIFLPGRAAAGWAWSAATTWRALESDRGRLGSIDAPRAYPVFGERV